MTADLRDAALRFFPDIERFTLLGGSSGYSGSAFGRVEARGASWCVRRRPAGFGAARLRAIHRALAHSRAHGFRGVPTLARTGAGETALAASRRLYDAQGWIAGEPLSGSPAGTGPTPNAVTPLPAARLAALAGALASFHRSTMDLSPGPGDLEMPLARRLAGMREELRASEDGLATAVGAWAEGEERTLALRWLELLPRAMDLAEATIGDHPDAARDTSTLCHGDLWAPHVFFAGPAFAGLTDFEGVCFSSPALDLAQLVLHFDGWPSRARVVEAYEAVQPITEEDHAMLNAAALLDLAGEGSWAIGRLAGADRRSPQAAAHVANLRRLLPSLELLIPEEHASRTPQTQA